MRGSFDQDSPYIEIEVYGHSKENIQKIKAMIDTGFNGYLAMPYEQAFPLGLILVGLQSSKIADGSIVRHLACLGNVIIDGQEIKTAVSIQPGCPILVGTQLLKAAKKCLKIDFNKDKIEIN